MTQISRMAGSL